MKLVHGIFLLALLQGCEQEKNPVLNSPASELSNAKDYVDERLNSGKNYSSDRWMSGSDYASDRWTSGSDYASDRWTSTSD